MEVYAEFERRDVALPPPAAPRAGVLDEVWSAIVQDAPPLHDGRWGAANIAVCLAVLASSRARREIRLDDLETDR